LAQAGAVHTQVQLLLLQEARGGGLKQLLQMKLSGMRPLDTTLVVVTVMRVGTQAAYMAWGVSVLAQQQQQPQALGCFITQVIPVWLVPTMELLLGAVQLVLQLQQLVGL
jgi:hypothetical protein